MNRIDSFLITFFFFWWTNFYFFFFTRILRINLFVGSVWWWWSVCVRMYICCRSWRGWWFSRRYSSSRFIWRLKRQNNLSNLICNYEMYDFRWSLWICWFRSWCTFYLVPFYHNIGFRTTSRRIYDFCRWFSMRSRHIFVNCFWKQKESSIMKLSKFTDRSTFWLNLRILFFELDIVVK